MAADSTGNFFPILPDLPPITTGFGEVRWGAGAPSDADGNNGDLYVDLSTGDVYQKSGDTWALVTGGGGATEVSKGVVDPEGVVAKATPHFYVNTANSTLWFKTSGGAGTTTLWTQYI